MYTNFVVFLLIYIPLFNLTITNRPDAIIPHFIGTFLCITVKHLTNMRRTLFLVRCNARHFYRENPRISVIQQILVETGRTRLVEGRTRLVEEFVHICRLVGKTESPAFNSNFLYSDLGKPQKKIFL